MCARRLAPWGLAAAALPVCSELLSPADAERREQDNLGIEPEGACAHIEEIQPQPLQHLVQSVGISVVKRGIKGFVPPEYTGNNFIGSS